MAFLAENSTWEAGIYQIETVDPVQGGAAGISNTQPKQLTNRTKKIHDVLELNGIFITGSLVYKGQNIIPSATFEGSVADGNMVYYHTINARFEKALADGTDKENVVGIANVTLSQVFAGGLISKAVGGAVAGDTLYLSDITPGVITTTQTTKALGKYLYSSIIYLSFFGAGESGAASTGISEADVYSDLLNTSQYQNATLDAFIEITANNVLIDSTTMDYDAVETKYDFTIGEILTSTNLRDALSGVSPITEAMISIDFTDAATPTIEMTADGTNWETVENNVKHTFVNTGTDLRLRFTAGGTGEIKSWGVFYNPEDGSVSSVYSPIKMVNFYFEGIVVDEDIIIDGIYFNQSSYIRKITINARVAPTGANLTIDILKDGSEETNLATLTDASLYETTSLDAIEFSSAERFGLKIKSVGSTNPGQGLNITVHYSDK